MVLREAVSAFAFLPPCPALRCHSKILCLHSPCPKRNHPVCLHNGHEPAWWGIGCPVSLEKRLLFYGYKSNSYSLCSKWKSILKVGEKKVGGKIS